MATAAPTAEARTGERVLLGAATFFAVAVALHNADHVRRGADAVDTDVLASGTAAIVLEVAVVVLICQRHRLAPLAATAVGAGLAAGYVVVHFLPERSWLSDPLTDGPGVNALSWFAASLEVLAALVLAWTGWRALAGRGGLASATAPHPGERSLAAAWRHPLALAFGASQAVTLVLTFSTA